MTVVDVAGTELVLVVAAAVVIANVAIARSERRTNRELPRAQRERTERRTDDTRG